MPNMSANMEAGDYWHIHNTFAAAAVRVVDMQASIHKMHDTL